MRRWIVLICLCVAVHAGFAQDDEAAKANALWQAGKRIDALPLYEDLFKAYPDQWLYAERLAVALDMKAENTVDSTERKALIVRMKDVAKRAVALGDTNYFVQLMTNFDPNHAALPGTGSPAAPLIQEGEKDFDTGDYADAILKYEAAAQADPTLYEAPLYAGDAAYAEHDLKTAAKWFQRAIKVNPNRETAYRYWGDAILRYGSDPEAAREKYIDAVVAEPYNRLAWQGLQQWAQVEKAVLMAPRIDRPASPVVDPKNPNNVTVQIDPTKTNDKKDPGSSAWMMYSIVRASYHGDLFKKEFPGEKTYRHSLKEEDAALSIVAETVKEKKIPTDKLDESLRNLVTLYDAGMLDCWILINGADDGIAQDYARYRDSHRQLLHDYLERYVVNGGLSPPQ